MAAVRSVRVRASPNPGFMAALRALESDLGSDLEAEGGAEAAVLLPCIHTGQQSEEEEEEEGECAPGGGNTPRSLGTPRSTTRSGKLVPTIPP